MRAEGRPLRAIATTLNADAVPTRTGAPWAAGTILKVLRRPTAPGSSTPPTGARS